MNNKFLFFAIGNALLDIIIKTDEQTIRDLNLHKGTMKLITENELHNLQNFINDNKKYLIPAGSAGNTAKIAALMGQKPIFFGSIGDDKNGNAYYNGMENLGIKTILKKHHNSPTGICLSLITPDGERTMLTFLGCAGELDQTIIDRTLLEKSRYIYIEGYQFVQEKGKECIRSIIEISKKSNNLIALDLSDPFIAIGQKENILSIMNNIDILFANEQEAYAFSETKDPEESIKYLKKLVDIPVIKLGDKGSMTMDNDTIIHVPAESIKPIDTTGAGDSYSAGFLTAHNMGFCLEECLGIGNMTAKEMIKIYGTELEKTNLEHIIKRLRQ